MGCIASAISGESSRSELKKIIAKLNNKIIILESELSNAKYLNNNIRDENNNIRDENTKLKEQLDEYITIISEFSNGISNLIK